MWTSFSPTPSLENADWAGELGPLDPMLAMLARVDARSRPVGFQLLKMEGPNGELVPGICANGLRWGIEPARRRDKRADELDELSGASKPGEGDLKGLWEGVGRDDLGVRAGMLSRALPAPPGENLEGTVPARARLVWGRLSGEGSWAKSGKPSVGDSGMFSRRGVELPLVGGPPQGLTGKPGTPSWACISRALQSKEGGQS